LLAVSVLGQDRPGLVHELTRLVADAGGNLIESRMTGLGNQFAILMLIGGNWHAVGKVERELQKLQGGTDFSLQVHRTDPRTVRVDQLSYTVEFVCPDQTGVVSAFSGFFSARNIDIAECDCHTYVAVHTGAPMTNVRMVVNVPARIHLGVLREEFMDFCDHLNLDAILEPVKG
jgi:glycine cleavage system transcriptional repressor